MEAREAGVQDPRGWLSKRSGSSPCSALSSLRVFGRMCIICSSHYHSKLLLESPILILKVNVNLAFCFVYLCLF